jgi:hypothetical protein
VYVYVRVSVCPSDYETYRDALGDAEFTRITSTPRLTPRLARAAEWIAAANSQHQLPRTPRSSIPYSGAEMHARERAASEMHDTLRELSHEHPPTSARLRAASEMNAMNAAAQVANMAGIGQGRGGQGGRERGQSLGMEWGDMRSTIAGVRQGGDVGGSDRRVDVSERNAYSGKREGACTGVHSDLVCVDGDGEVLGVMLLQSLSPKYIIYI